MSDNETGRSFAALGIDPDLVDALSAQGILEPFPIQALTIPDALAGRDICGKAKTGSGKTLAFGLPLLQRLSGVPEAGEGAGPATGMPTGAATDGESDEAGPGRSARRRSRPPRGLVLVPTRELARQVADVLEPLAEARRLSLGVCYGGTNMEAQVKAVRAGMDVVIATPGRLIDLRQRGEIDLGQIEIVVLDEADRMADMGFTPQVEWLLRHLVKPHQSMLFSATLDGDVDRLIRHELTDPVYHEVVSATATVTGMAHRFIQVHQMDKVKLTATICRGNRRTIVFTRTKRNADRLTDSLRKEGVDARAIHGDLRQQARERALKAFSEGRLKVLVATDVAARGLDVEDIDVVIHYDPPEDHKAYLHRSGRTARAGREGLVVTLVLWNEHMEVERIQKRLGLRAPIVEMFSNDPRLAHLSSWEPEPKTAG
ncbi:MAG TPA: DEAD/DEAH box helicase [Acidimicrobiales bacterium]|nr:DEAD/DEAH box helicase [Acidimicrobiales bacterium]